MANRPHVPKFGDWSNQDQPFTVVFNNARTNKQQGLYDSLESSDIKPPAKVDPPPPAKVAPPPQAQPTPRVQRPEPPKTVRDDPPKAPPPQPERKKVIAPPADQLYGAGGGGRSGGGGGGGARGGGDGGLYGGFGGGSGSVNQRPAQTPPRQVQFKPNPRAGRGGTTIPPFPGSVGSGDNMSYTHIFEKVKEERREGVMSYGSSTGTTPSRPFNNQHESPAPKPSMFCCFSWCPKGSKY